MSVRFKEHLQVTKGGTEQRLFTDGSLFKGHVYNVFDRSCQRRIPNGESDGFPI